MNIIFAGSNGKTGSIIYNYLLQQGYKITNTININENLEQIIQPNSIVIDFTTKESSIKHSEICLKHYSHLICGTTGIDDKTIKSFLKQAKEKRLFFEYNANFSLGITTLIKPLNELSKLYTNTQIIESHHISKKDLPSGTALLINKHLKNKAHIESVRTTYQTLNHTIVFKNDYEEITIIHKVNNKLAYALGVEKSLKRLLNKLKCD